MSIIQTKLRELVSAIHVEKRSLDDLLTNLAKFAGNMAPTMNDLRQEANGRATYFSRIADFFVRENNQPRTVQEIADGINGVKPSVCNVLYGTHKKFFLSENVPGFKRQVVWHLTQEAFEQYVQRQASS
jgi:hypothetical protein